MKKSVYTTLAAKPTAKQNDDILRYYDEMRLLDAGRFIRVGKSPIFKVAPGTEGLTQWDLPLLAKDGLLIDTRMFEKAAGTVSKAYELRYLYNRALLENEWLTNDVNFSALMDPLVVYYSEWLRQIVAKRFSINYLQQAYYHLFFAFYYWQAILDSDTRKHMADEDVALAFGRFAKRTLKATPTVVDDIMQSEHFKRLVNSWDGGNVISLNMVCGAANDFVDSPAISVDTAMLAGFAIAGSWFGHIGPMIAATAIEHPPMFAHMVYLAAENSSYRTTLVGQAVETASRRIIKPDNLVRWVRILHDQYDVTV